MLWLSIQEYLRLSDVYRMYGNASLQPPSSSPAALHCISLTVSPALPCEVDRFSALCSLTVSPNVLIDAFSYPSFEHCLLSLFCKCLHVVFFCICVKEYVTVSQLSQIFGMQRVNPSSSSSTPSFQLASSESAFSCRSTACGPSSFFSAQVCSI